MKFLLNCYLLIVAWGTYAQSMDTLTFHSAAFGSNRTIYVRTPSNYKYKADSISFPIIYILDGQHEWFVNPILSNIQYLQYTKDLPETIVVVIPLENRVQECMIHQADTPTLPLHTFLTQELPQQIRTYSTSELRVLIGHSFSASFALYSFLHAPQFYTAILAHSPADQLHKLITLIKSNQNIEKGKIYISVGGIQQGKDDKHRAVYETAATKHADFFKQIHRYEATNAKHNAVPIIATPIFLNELFAGFGIRFAHIARVDAEYQLIQKPASIEKELALVRNSSNLLNAHYPAEISDINGIASRYWLSGYTTHAIALFEWGLRYYPNYYEFYVSLADLYKDIDVKKSLYYIDQAENLLNTIDINLEARANILEEIKQFKQKYNR